MTVNVHMGDRVPAAVCMANVFVSQLTNGISVPVEPDDLRRPSVVQHVFVGRFSATLTLDNMTFKILKVPFLPYFISS